MQGRLLSSEQPATISLAAFSISAVSSTTTGGFPAPAPIAFLPLERAVLTTPGPPVATIIRIIGWFNIMFVFSIEGASTVVTRFAGAPASASALLIVWIMYRHTSRARGWGLNTTLFPAASIPIELQMMVSVGFVVGVIDPMTPKGEYSTKVRPSSPLIASVTKSSVPGVFSAARRFLIILLE